MGKTRKPKYEHGIETIESMPYDKKVSLESLKENVQRFHGTRLSLNWFPWPMVNSSCADKFGYLSSTIVRTSSRLPFTAAVSGLLENLGSMMADSTREPAVGPGDPPNSGIPAGYTYFGQFVDHDITFDISSTLDSLQNANNINNMRSPSLDLDSLYGRGPGLDPFLYQFPSGGTPATAIKFQLGTNQNNGPGGSSTNSTSAGMIARTNFDVPRANTPSNTALIGDPRNDENLIVSQFHHAMLRFHNKVVDKLISDGFAGDIFAEAKRMVTHHYQWAVVHDFLKRICGNTAVNNALSSVVAPIGSAFRMPVEFSVAAYRFGHSIIRQNYWLNFNFPNEGMNNVFNFIRNPHLPVRSNWVIDFNAFFPTGHPVPVNNMARKIDSILATEMENLPGMPPGIMRILAARNLRRGQALGLPSGQALASSLGVTPLTSAQLTSGLPPSEVALLNSNGGILLTRTPLWYYILREAAVTQSGNKLGPLGAKIVADTFIRILKRDANSFLNHAGGFSPSLQTPPATTFTVTDIIKISGVTQP